MAIEKTYLEWYPAANQIFRVGFGAMEELVAAETALDPTGDQVVELHHLTSERPEQWEDISEKVSITSVGVVDDDENEVEDGAVQFRMTADVDGDPEPGDDYSFFIMADRADDPTLQVATRVWLRIMP